MSIKYDPIILNGNWDLGYALDVHIISSVPLGEDAYGHQRFDNLRSPLGELLYDFKYNQKYSNLTEIVHTNLDFLDKNPEMKNIQVISPVPPTKIRSYQPTFAIAEALANELTTDNHKVFYINDILENNSSVEAKGLSSLEKHKLKGTIEKKKNAKYKHSMLLIDDLYQTGATLTQCVNLLREDPLVDKIYVLTVTKTKNR